MFALSSASMINPKNYDSRRNNSTLMLFDRYMYPQVDYAIRRRLQTHPSHIQRLELEAVLNGHEGCVNCLEWSTNGRLLASGSDDFQLCLWDPFRRKRLHAIHTKHYGNMFSVKFLPKHNDALIATAAADKSVMLFDINSSQEAIYTCHCHGARVKRLATAPDSPYVFWSAGEDGVILQLDHREKHTCRSEDNRVRLINLTTYIDTNAEAKCIALNPVKTELLAVGANDPYARIYDRRMLTPSSSAAVLAAESFDNGRPIPKDCVNYFCPGHINKNNSKVIEHEPRAITYLTFNPTGTELLVNMGAEHIYLYDLLNAEQPVFLNLPEFKLAATTCLEAEPDNCAEVTIPKCSSSNRRKLPENIDEYKKLGNELLENEQYLRAINTYSHAIGLESQWPVLYLNRATAYMRRLWFGDVYAALRDCHKALRLDCSYIKAHFRLARALLELGRPQEADECLKELIRRFPSYANNHGVLMLNKDIKENRQTTQSQQQANEAYNRLELSDDEFYWRSKAKDYSLRFVGHCNITTDIKEANYFGYNGDYIVAGSDDGNFFIWDRKTCNIHSVYKADSAIVNCVVPHPDICMMATSGIDHNIKIWSPLDGTTKPNAVTGIEHSVESNQMKMKTDPFDISTRNLLCWNG
ncbi:WD and tetratricopeptide repeats protein 1 isoform X1 [Glossina fuscipes]|uniref:WD and tetratricopeptide repeats protein 1 isoform X1 n=2 Tax=Glossina fuscipes TaxID=7396 RepID=A0A9C5YW13_9MUSC|nr:WD and tetratricopeptide repeats protein 1 isoform X1 [Glossina fuscipes]